MRRRPRSFAHAAVLLLCIVFLAACNCAPTLRYVSVSPTSATINAGFTQQFTATAYYSDGTVVVGQTGASWTSSSTSVATITAGGLASGLTGGTTTITASEAGASATATLTVNQAFTAIVVNCIPGSIAVGQTSNCTATGNPGGIDVTPQATWSTSNANATVTVAGVATGVAVPSSNIIATFAGLTGSFSLAITPPAVTGITISPATNPIAVGNTTLYTALETLSSGPSQTPVGTVTWTATNCNPAPAAPTPGAASIVGGTPTNGIGNGFAIANGAFLGSSATGSCTITATDGSFQATSTLNVVIGTTHNAYVSTPGTANVTQFSVDATSTTAPFKPLSSPVTTTGPDTVQTIVHPSGQWVYAIDPSSNVHIFDVASGVLTIRSGDPSTSAGGGGGANKGVIDPTGQYMYVTDDTVPSVTALTINQTTGLLTKVQTITANLSSPEDVLVDRQGLYVYVVDQVLNQVNGYSIQSDGTLVAFSPTANWSTGSAPYFSTIDPSNTYLFVPNSTDNTVSEFTISSTGTLNSPATLATAAFGTTPAPFSLANLVVDPTDKFLYVLDSPTTAGNVYAFGIGSGGVIGSLIGSQPTGAAPIGIVIDPTGKLVAVDNNFDDNISVFAVGATGALTPDTPATVTTGTGSAPQFVTFLNAP